MRGGAFRWSWLARRTVSPRSETRMSAESGPISGADQTLYVCEDGRRVTLNDLIAGKSLERVLGHETVTAGIAGPEIADDVVGQISGRFCRHH